MSNTPDSRHECNHRYATRTGLSVSAVVALFVLAVPAAAFESDSHYYLRYGLALATCFDWDESRLIASGDWNMDANGSTHAEMNPVQRRNKIDWHAFGHSDRRFNELWLRSAAEADLDLRLIYLGQFMHFLEDWEAHAGYGVRLGHARDTFRGRDPDSLGSSPARNHTMVQSALDHLLKTCEELGRLDVDRDSVLIEIMTLLSADGLVDVLFEESDPSWKRGRAGGFRPIGRVIKRANQTRIEEFVERYLAHLPHKHVPDEFEPGTESGIPAFIPIPYDRNGNVIVRRSVKRSLANWAAAAERAPDVALSLDRVQIDYRGSRTRPAGWRLRVRATNQGYVESNAGQIEFVVIDSDDERLLAESTEPLPALAPGESRAFRVRIPAAVRPEPDVIVGAFARVGDLSAMNDEDWLMLGNAEEERPDVPLITDLDPPPPGQETVSFLHPPKTFVVDDIACVLVTAYTSGGDSSEKLDRAVFELLGSGYDPDRLQSVAPGHWSAMATDTNWVAAKTFECFEPGPAASEPPAGEEPIELRLAVTLEAEGLDPQTEEFPLDPEFVAKVLEIAGITE